MTEKHISPCSSQDSYDKQEENIYIVTITSSSYYYYYPITTSTTTTTTPPPTHEWAQTRLLSKLPAAYIL